MLIPFAASSLVLALMAIINGGRILYLVIFWKLFSQQLFLKGTTDPEIAVVVCFYLPFNSFVSGCSSCNQTHLIVITKTKNNYFFIVLPVRPWNRALVFLLTHSSWKVQQSAQSCIQRLFNSSGESAVELQFSLLTEFSKLLAKLNVSKTNSSILRLSSFINENNYHRMNGH